ncbi:MAG: alpha-D-glucose phosphate-specific phosphoglucomutase [Alphaproteobacteria bacterium]|nr:alpha-D-glucose phosphate-specific phosphoglucomutase [Alphaproteobacteria bacterium]
MDIVSVKTEPYSDQTFGTSGLRKKTAVFRQKHYLENIVQSVFDSLNGFEGKTLVIGGDGRFFNDEAVQTLIRLAIANQFGRIIVGQNGLLSTPATSHIITKYNAFGGFILSASHNPGGRDGDFGIKFDTASGAPAPVALTTLFSERAKVIDRFWTIDLPDFDLSLLGERAVGHSIVQVVDPVADYAAYMRDIFDFPAIKKMLAGGFKMIFDAMNAATGPYARHIFEEALGAPAGSVIHGTPQPDFGGLHPDPNLIYAKHLADMMYADDAPDFAAASDGDGDRYMILGKNFFVNPSDSLAVLTEHLHAIPFYRGKINGVARSFATSPAVDAVAAAHKIPVYETPVGWKFFGSLLDAGKITLCGEESFGAGSSHLREKDGLWAVLAWLNIMAATQKTPEELTRELWRKYGRVYALAHNYESLNAEAANKLMMDLNAELDTLPGRQIGGLTIRQAFNFSYADPASGETAADQGICLVFDGQKRAVIRLSGTGSVGATLRFYFNGLSGKRLNDTPQAFLSDIVAAVGTLTRIAEQTGRDAPTTIT